MKINFMKMKNGENIIAIIYITLIILLSCRNEVYSLGADTAHPYIAEEAAKIWPGDPKDPNTPAPQEAKNEFWKYLKPDPPQKGIAQGSTDEDYLGYYQFVPGGAKGYIPALWHYYNLSEPCIGVRAVGGVRSAVDFAEELFSFAVNVPLGYTHKTEDKGEVGQQLNSGKK